MDILNKIICSDCLEAIKNFDENSIDAIVTDPPYELGFMGKKWDALGIAYNVELWKECLRVLKPGGHLLAFGGTRTYHRMACAIEDAGFEIRDMAEWVYRSGFPKSLNVGKKYDQLQGNEREDKEYEYPDGSKRQVRQSGSDKYAPLQGSYNQTKGNSEWEGFGSALKPAHEPICMARKPLSEKTIVDNVIKWGTGALDIDGCRIPTSEKAKFPEGIISKAENIYGNGKGLYGDRPRPGDIKSNGRFPANIIVTCDALNDGEMTKSTANVRHNNPSENIAMSGANLGHISFGHNDSGSKSRYFDIDVWAEKHGLLQFPKASKRERNEGCEGLEEKIRQILDPRPCDNNINSESAKYTRRKPVKNNHPTVKPVHLISWLVRLISKEGDTVLDPFCGSGTTGVACKKLNRHFIGIEQDPEYCKIANARTGIDKNPAMQENELSLEFEKVIAQ